MVYQSYIYLPKSPDLSFTPTPSRGLPIFPPFPAVMDSFPSSLVTDWYRLMFLFLLFKDIFGSASSRRYPFINHYIPNSSHSTHSSIAASVVRVRSIDLSVRICLVALRDVYKSGAEESILLEVANAVELWIWIRKEKNRCSIILALCMQGFGCRWLHRHHFLGWK